MAASAQATAIGAYFTDSKNIVTESIAGDQLEADANYGNMWFCGEVRSGLVDTSK
jgi:hypothetical protein